MAAPTPTATERMTRLYGRQAGIYDGTRRLILFGRTRLVDALGLRPGDRVLDVGCGTGWMLPILAERVGPTGSVCGIECVRAMAEHARRRAGSLGNVEVIESELAHADLASRRFDAVVLSYALTLMPDWRDVVDRVEGLLEAGGRLGVVDFIDATWPACHAFEAHGIRFEPGIRDRLTESTDPVVDETRRAYGGLWRYFVWVGVTA